MCAYANISIICNNDRTFNIFNSICKLYNRLSYIVTCILHFITYIHTYIYNIGWNEILNNYGDLIMTRDSDVIRGE